MALMSFAVKQSGVTSVDSVHLSTRRMPLKDQPLITACQ